MRLTMRNEPVGARDMTSGNRKYGQQFSATGRISTGDHKLDGGQIAAPVNRQQRRARERYLKRLGQPPEPITPPESPQAG